MTQVKKFDAEVGKVLQLMIHSLYTNKDIFLRELISNASDACDKLRYLSISDSSLIKDDPEFKIKVSIQKDNRLLIIEDNGIGMNEAELSENLGTIARSGTQKFLEQISGDSKKDNMLIGQFGVGFYSAFMIASSIKVISHKAGEEKAYFWISDGTREYEIGAAENDELKRGTRILISIKEGEDKFLDHFKIKNTIKSYSDHVSISIMYVDENGVEVQVNSSSALWAKSKTEITPEQYKEFYKSISHSADDPWIILHNKNEGTVEFTNLLFIPQNKTFDLFHPDRKRRVKLYIKRVFITDEGIEIVPRYLRFLRGIIDCEDLPLNISRETLQDNNIIDKICTSVTTRVLNDLKKRKEEERELFEKFWANFGAVMKEGLCESNLDHEKLLEVCIFKSVKHQKMISLDEYINDMREGQKNIYFLSGDNESQMLSSPHIEGLISKDIDVLLFTDPVDDFWVNINHQYKEYRIISVTKDELEINQHSSENITEDKEANKDHSDKEVINYFKNVLENLVADVKISQRLTTSPVCVVSTGIMDMRMERFLVEQKQLGDLLKKILEINIKHPIIEKIKSDLKGNKNSSRNDNIVKVLFNQGCILAGEPIDSPKEFSEIINNIIIDTQTIK